MEIKLTMRCTDVNALFGMFESEKIGAGTQVSLGDGITAKIDKYDIRDSDLGDIITLILAATQTVLTTPGAIDVIYNWVNKGRGHVVVYDEKTEIKTPEGWEVTIQKHWEEK